MPRLQNVNSGATVSVSDELAELLDSEWVAPQGESQPEPEQKPAAKRTSSK
jgi:hypothetical protein